MKCRNICYNYCYVDNCNRNCLSHSLALLDGYSGGQGHYYCSTSTFYAAYHVCTYAQ